MDRARRKRHAVEGRGSFSRFMSAVCVLSFALYDVACTPLVDLKQALQITDLSGGWFDAGIVDGKNKLVPSVTFRVKKSTDSSIRPLALNLVFKRIVGQTEEEFDETFLQTVHFSEGQQTAPLTVRATHGYTADAPQTRAEMLQNSQFRDMRVVIFAKHSSNTWVEMARYDIPRRLLTK